LVLDPVSFAVGKVGLRSADAGAREICQPAKIKPRVAVSDGLAAETQDGRGGALFFCTDQLYQTGRCVFAPYVPFRFPRWIRLSSGRAQYHPGFWWGPNRSHQKRFPDYPFISASLAMTWTTTSELSSRGRLRSPKSSICCAKRSSLSASICSSGMLTCF